MNVDVVGLFFWPRKVVREAVARPNFLLSALLVAFPVLLLGLARLFFSFEMDFVNPLLLSFAAWLVFSLAFYFAVWVVKGKKHADGKFGSISSAVALAWVFFSIAGLLFFVAIAQMAPLLQVIQFAKDGLSYPPEKSVELAGLFTQGDLAALKEFEKRNGMPGDVRQRLEELFAGFQSQPANFSLFSLLMVLLAIPALFGLFILPYLAVSEIFQSNRLVHLLAWFLIWFLPVFYPVLKISQVILL